jgi:putative hydrolase of the HAD superfamily
MVHGVIFDFDGTLVDNIDADIFCLRAVQEACNAFCSTEEFVDVAVEEIINFHSLVDDGKEDPLFMHQFRLKNTINRFGIPWDQRYLIIYQEMMLKKIKPFKGVNKLLASIKNRDIKLGIISNAYDSNEQHKRIKCSGLEPYFDEIVISGEVGYYKPYPEIFHIALKRLGLSAEKTIYIGDIEKYDIEGAIAAGMQSILLNRNRTYSSALANHTCHSINDLQKYIDKLIA